MSPLLLVLVVVWVEGAPLPSNPQDLEPFVERFLQELWEKMHGEPQEDIYDRMQGDQPRNDVQADIAKILSLNYSSTPTNLSEYIQTSKNRQREGDVDHRAKDNWIQVIKENILHHIGRSNMTVSNRINAMNMTMSSSNDTLLSDDQITEKIRSYYPSCDSPTNMDQDLWREENMMNLYFKNFDQSADEKGPNIATATLRLYRFPSVNSTKTAGKTPDCDTSATSEEDKLIRVSIYWYTRSVRKKKVKRRLSDSKMISESAKWVELSVKPATRAWSKGRNLGLAVMVEDQESNVLRADRFFKGALCMVGASTPKPIPTIIVDAARQSNELDERIHSLLGGNSTTALSGDISMLPTIDVCTLEFPENYSHPPHIGKLRINACHLKQSYDQAQLLAERDRFERLATLPRHIRHQKHLKMNDLDPRPNIVNKRVLTSKDLQALNITTIHR